MDSFYTLANNMSICAHVFAQIRPMHHDSFMDKRDIKDVVEGLIKSKNLNQNALEKDGVPQPTINRILRGRHKTLALYTAMKIANFFKISLDQLVGNEPLLEDHEQWFKVKTLWTRLDKEKKDLAVKMVETMAERRHHDAPTDIEKRTGRVINHPTHGHEESNSVSFGKAKNKDMEKGEMK